jgi:hypothetical protein
MASTYESHFVQTRFRRLSEPPPNEREKLGPGRVGIIRENSPRKAQEKVVPIGAGVIFSKLLDPFFELSLGNAANSIKSGARKIEMPNSFGYERRRVGVAVAGYRTSATTVGVRLGRTIRSVLKQSRKSRDFMGVEDPPFWVFVEFTYLNLVVLERIATEVRGERWQIIGRIKWLTLGHRFYSTHTHGPEVRPMQGPIDGAADITLGVEMLDALARPILVEFGVSQPCCD